MKEETERHEPGTGAAHGWEAARREFFRFLGSGGIVVLFSPEQAEEVSTAPQGSAGGRRGGPGVSLPREIGAWLHVGEDGQVTAYTGKVEVGQDIRTSLTQAVAEELRVLPASVRLVMGDTDLSPFDRGTAGSRTTPSMAPQLRRAAAAARDLLLDLAVKRGEADRSTLSVAGGAIVERRAGRAFPFGDLAKGQQLLWVVGEDMPTMPAEEWQVVGTSVPKITGRAMVTGRHRYASDLKRSGMLYGKVLRPPSLGAARLSLDTRAGAAMPGVTVIRDGDFVGVVATDELTAERALGAIHVEWVAAERLPSDREIFDYLRGHTADGVGNGLAPQVVHTAGSVADGLTASDRRLAASYTAAYIAHAPL
jgi:isoquinoline 1-oxidoreductase